MATLNRKSRIGLLLLVSLIAITALVFTGPIPQDPRYHLFADTSQVLGVGNFWNIASNLPFILVGLIGLSRCPRLTRVESRTGFIVFCAAAILVGIGSAYYHVAPSNGSLLWDRLPMAMAFMAFFSILLGERVITRYRRSCLWLLVFTGLSAVVYWSWTESLGRGDLRPYLLVQFLPVLLIPLIIFLFPSRYLSNTLLLVSFALYFVAKLLEHFDAEVLDIIAVTGGHALKHVAAAVAGLCIVYSVPCRGGSMQSPRNVAAKPGRDAHP
jgi:hypothetical protein